MRRLAAVLATIAVILAPTPAFADEDPLEAALNYHENLDNFIERIEAEIAAAAAEAAEQAEAEAAAEAAAVDREVDPSRSSDRTASSDGLNWYALRVCESGNTYTRNSGNGYYGAYQFSLSTWQAIGGPGYPHEAAPSTQDYYAQKLLNMSGDEQWPVCGDLLYS